MNFQLIHLIIYKSNYLNYHHYHHRHLKNYDCFIYAIPKKNHQHYPRFINRVQNQIPKFVKSTQFHFY